MKTHPTQSVDEPSFIGIDYHKRYSVYCALDAQGEVLGQGRIDHIIPEDFLRLVERWPGCRIVFEASMNWHWLYEILEQVLPSEDIVLANPFKTRIIAEAQIKTDKIDARALANLLRANLVSCVHVPCRQTREIKDVLRQRCFFVRQRTMLRNRIHRLLGGQHDLKLPQCSDLFGKKGLSFLEKLELPDPAGLLLTQQLALLKELVARIREDERALAGMLDDSPELKRVRSIPGMGPILAAVVVAEIDGIGRFPSAQKLCGYAGLCPSTSSSGGKTHQGRLLTQCNKWLRWAFVEAAWVAVGCSPYFGDYYKAKRAHGKKANTAILATARRMARITWSLLTQERTYTNFPVTQKLRCQGRDAGVLPRRGPAKERVDPPTPKDDQASLRKSSSNNFPSRSNARLVGR